MLVIVSIVLTSAYYELTEANEICAEGEVKVFFCPEDACADAVISLIDSANESVHVAVYSFTLDSIADALIRAKQRGVDVKVVLESQQVSQYSVYEKLKDAGIDVLLDSNPAYMHDKIAVIDGRIVITGSYNWTKRATNQNNENLVVIYSKKLSEEFEAELEKIYSSAKALA